MKKSKKYNPLISILMPVYNAGDFLVEAIKSIKKQTYRNWELIAINDGSTDNSLEILKRFAKRDKRIKIIGFSQNKGLAYALNLGIKKAKGEFLARMDADDISLPNRLEKQLKFLLKHKEIILVGTQVEMVDEKGSFINKKFFPVNHKKIYEMMFEMMPVQHATILTYSKIMKKCLYENHTTAEDVSMFFKLLSMGKLANTKEVLYKYRLRKNSNSLKNPKKTFNLTLKSRIKAVLNWGYSPTPKGIIINAIQFIVISLLPESMIMALYKLVRFNRSQPKILLRHLIKKLARISMVKGRPAFSVK